MANRETVYEALVALRAESAQLRTDLSKASSVLEGGLKGMGGLAKQLAPVLSIAGAAAFGKSVLDTAGHLTDLSEQTQISAQFLSGIKSTLEESGSSVDTFARAIFIAQKNLGGIDEEGDQAAQAIKRLGLNVEELQAASPERFLELVGKALENITNPTDRAAIGAKIFGKAWQEVSPVISNIAAHIDELRASGMTEADIKKLDDFGDALTRIGNLLQIAAAGPLADFADGLDRIFNFSPGAKLTNQLVAVNDEIDKIDRTLATHASIGARFAEALNPTKSISFGTDEELIARKKELLALNQKLAAQQLDSAKKPAAAGDGASATAAKAAIEAAKAQAKAVQDLVAITRELDQSAMTPLGKTVDDIRVKYTGFAATGASAFKGQAAALDGFNAKLDVTREKLIGLAKQQVGQTAVQKFEQQFDVKFEVTKKAAAQDLAQNFVAIFNQFKNDRSAQDTLSTAFSHLVEQAIKDGVPDIPELLASVGLTDLGRFTSKLSPELSKGFEDSRKAGEQWGKTMAAETAVVDARFQAIAEALDLAKQKTDELVDRAAQQLSINLDTTRAIEGLTGVKQWLDSIPDRTYKSIVFTTYGAASPRRPFSDFVSHLEDSLGTLTRDRSAEIVYNVGQNLAREDRTTNLETNVGAGVGGSTPVNPAFDGATAQARRLHREMNSIVAAMREINANPIRPII